MVNLDASCVKNVAFDPVDVEASCVNCCANWDVMDLNSAGLLEAS